jgi:hypothetical protein
MWLVFAGLIGLVGSAMVFVVSNLPEVYKILAWKDRIKIWQFDSQSQNFHTIISNTGDGPVIVSAIVLYSSNGGNNQIDIRKTIAPHESISESKDNQTGVAEYQTYPSNASGTPNSLMLSHSGFIIDDFANPGGLCSLIHFFDKGAVDVKRIQDFYSAHGSKLIVTFAEGSVKYYSLHNEKEMETRFPVLETYPVARTGAS